MPVSRQWGWGCCGGWLPGGSASASKVLPFDRLVPELAAGNPLALVNLGVLFLLATPGVTLFAAIISFLGARNWRYAAIASIVGATLLLSLILSLVGADKAFQAWLQSWIDSIQGR
jgi:Protein of unknown function (DUF1634)